MAVLSAERIKITTTKSPLWCSVIIVVLALGFAAIMGAVAKSALTSLRRPGSTGPRHRRCHGRHLGFRNHGSHDHGGSRGHQ